MNKIILLIILQLCGFSMLQAKVKEVQVSNGTDSIITVYITQSDREGIFGSEISTLYQIPAGKDTLIPLSSTPPLFKYINLIAVHGTGINRKEVLVSFHLNEKSSPKIQPFNFTGLKTRPVDGPEISKLYEKLEKVKEEFKKKNLIIDREYEANVGFDEYLGAIVIIEVDTSKAQNHKLKRIYRARQLGISSPPIFRGSDYNESVRLSQTFGISGDASFPGIFSVQIDFNSADLFEFGYKIFALGPVESQSVESRTVVDILFELDENSRSEIIQTIAQTLLDCPNCSVRKIDRVLAFKGGVVTTKRYREASKVWTGSAANVITNSGNYSYINGLDMDQYISAKILSLGVSEEQLETEILISAIAEVQKQIDLKQKEIDNSTLAMQNLHSEMQQLVTFKGSFEKILGIQDKEEESN